jgi:hypothetical protein
MAPQVLRACIAGNYIDLFKEILPHIHPDAAVPSDANKAGGSFKDEFQNRVAELDGKVTTIAFHEHWKTRSIRKLQVVSNCSSGYTGSAIRMFF